MAYKYDNLYKANARVAQLCKERGALPFWFAILGEANAWITATEAAPPGAFGCSGPGIATPAPQSIATLAATPPPRPTITPAIAAALAPARKQLMPLKQAAALHAAMFGQSSTIAVMAGPVKLGVVDPRLEKVTSEYKTACAKHGHTSPAAYRAHCAKVEMQERLKAEAVGSEADQLKRITADFAEKGIVVEGLDYSGTNPPHYPQLSASSIADANAFAKEFVSVITEPTSAASAMANSIAAKSARDYLQEIWKR
jgi:hypothetical protein